MSSNKWIARDVDLKLNMEIIVSLILGFAIGFVVKTIIAQCSTVGSIRILQDEDETYMTLEVIKGKLKDIYSKKSVVVNIVKDNTHK